MMQQTRWQILQILKRSGGNTVEELCHALDLAPMTVRQHLAILERDGHVVSGGDRRGHGRPSHVYTLSAAADDLFPKSYDKLVLRLLQEVARLQPEDLAERSSEQKVSLLLDRMAEGQAEALAKQLSGISLDERGAELAALLSHREGTLSTWAADGDGAYVMDDHNCPFRAVVEAQPELCQWHAHLLRTVLDADVTEERCIAAGANCCRHRIVPHGEPAPHAH